LTLFIEGVLIGLGYLVVYLYKFKKEIFNWKFKKSIAFKLLKDSWPLFFSSIAVVIYMKIDQIMIGEILGEKELGIYSAAVRISEMWYFVPVIISNSIFPAIIYAKKKSKKLYLNKLQKLYAFFLWFSAIMSILVFFIAPFLIKISFGEGYELSARVLSIHIWSGVAVFLGVASCKHLLAENLTRIDLYRTIIGVFVNIFLNFLLIPIYGIIGAAFATLISQFFSAYFSNLFFKKSRIIFIMFLKSFNIFILFKKIK
jgi:O-antigen/teichoic acid export membrane protein